MYITLAAVEIKPEKTYYAALALLAGSGNHVFISQWS